jgi:Flp pilus assembly pilin Flp
MAGYSVALSSDGSVVAIGAFGNDGNGNNSGHVRLYRNVDGIWTQLGQDIDGEARDESGTSVALSSVGSVVAIGADGNIFEEDRGRVRVYCNVEGTWTQVGQDIEGEVAGDHSGDSVALSSDGSVVAIGAMLNDGNGLGAGHVRLYRNVDETWTQIGEDIDGEAARDGAGQSVAFSSDGSVIAIGAISNDGNGEDSGHVRLYRNVNDTWTQIGEDINGEAAGDWSGTVALSSDGSVVAIGAMRNDGN